MYLFPWDNICSIKPFFSTDTVTNVSGGVVQCHLLNCFASFKKK